MPSTASLRPCRCFLWIGEAEAGRRLWTLRISPTGPGITSDLVFVNMKTEPSGPAPTPFHVAIPPIRPVLYFYDREGNPIAAESLVDVTGDLEIREDGGLTVQTQMDPLECLRFRPHGQGEVVTGSVKVVSDGPIGGMLRYDLPHIGEAVVGASPPLGDAIFPVRRQEGGITTGVALHNLESSPGLLRCDLMRRACCATPRASL